MLHALLEWYIASVMYYHSIDYACRPSCLYSEDLEHLWQLFLHRIMLCRPVGCCTVSPQLYGKIIAQVFQISAPLYWHALVEMTSRLRLFKDYSLGTLPWILNFQNFRGKEHSCLNSFYELSTNSSKDSCNKSFRMFCFPCMYLFKNILHDDLPPMFPLGVFSAFIKIAREFL